MYCAFATHILIRAKQAPIWEALSGQSSTFNYGENDQGPEYYSATYLAHIVLPQLTAVKLNRFLAEAGLSRRNGDQWEITARGKPFGMYVGLSGPRRSGKNDSRVIHWRLEVLDSLALYWPRPSETGDVGQQ